MELCVQCFFQGFCKNLKAKLVSDNELANSQFVLDVRQTANKLDIEPAQWLETIYDMYRDYPGSIMDENGDEVFLDLEAFELPFIREWFRDWACKPARENTLPRIRGESRERIRILATILRARFSGQAMMWGVVAANDNALSS